MAINIQEMLSLLDKAIEAARKPAEIIAGYLIYATASARPGISKDTISAQIIAENATYGINTGQMPDGTENVVNKFVCNLVEKVVDEIKYSSKVECTIPKGSILVVAQGSNAGGTVVAVGTNVNDATGYGFVR